MMMALVLSIPIWAGERTVTISRNEGIYDDGSGVYYCTKDGITMTFSSGLNNVNYLVEHQQVVFDIFSTNYVIKKIKFNCLDNTVEGNMDCFYWGPSTISEFTGSPYTPTGSYTYNGYIGTWTGGSTPSKYVKFVTRGKPVRFGSVEITYDKEFGDIYEKVTDDSEILNGHTYVLVSQYASKALGKEDYYGDDNLTTFTSTPVTLLDNKNKVKVTDDVQLIKLQSSGYSSRPWYIKVGDNYLRRRSGAPSGSSSGPEDGQGYNLFSVGSVTDYEQYFRVNITVSGNTNNNALIRFEHNSSETAAPSGGVTKTFAIRHYNGGSLFRDIDYSSNNKYSSNQRVYLYRPALSHEVTTECLPGNGGYITLGSGVLTDDQGRDWSQHFDNVTFFVGATDGYGIGQVTLTDISTGAVTVLQPTATSDFGNDYSFEMPDADVKITANFTPPHVIHTVIDPADGGSFNFINGYTDFNGQTTSNEGKTVTFQVEPAEGYVFNALTYTDNATGVSTTLTPDQNGVYTFVMPGNDVTLTAAFDPPYIVTTECTPSTGGQIALTDGVFDYGDDKASHEATTVSFRVSTNWGWRIRTVTAINLATGDPVDVTTVSTGEDGSTYSLVMPAGNVNIVAEFYETEPDLYLLGTANGKTGWLPNGPKFNYDPVAEEYYLDVYFKGGNDDPNVDPAYGYFSLTKKVDPDGIWANIAGYRLAAENNNTGVADGSTGVALYGDRPDNAFKIPAGIYRITVNKTMDQMSITEYPLSLTFNPESGATLTVGQNVTISSNLDQLVHNINPDETLASFKNSINGGSTWDNDNTATVTGSGPVTVTGQASIGYINVTGTADYMLPYNITLVSVPADACRFIMYSANNLKALPGTSVMFSLERTSARYGLIQVTVSYVDENNEPQTIVLERDEGEYYFVMPAADVTITAEYEYRYNITSVVIPEGSATVNCDTWASAGKRVSFNVRQGADYLVKSVTLSYVDENNVEQSIVLQPSADDYANYKYYEFIMPAADVTITVVMADKHSVSTVCTPPDGGRIIPRPYFSQEGNEVSFTVTENSGYALDNVSVTYVDENDVTQTIPVTLDGEGVYHFVMPDADVTIHAVFSLIPMPITKVCEPAEGGFIHVNDMATYNERVNFTVSSNEGYRLNRVVVTNDVTGTEVRTTLTDGQYGFTMPLAPVTITAYFEVPSDLYLLGTYNGNVEWAPTGPQFEYNHANDEYTLTVYFKGIRNVAGQEDDKSGYFSMTTVTHDTDWDYIQPYRLVARNPLVTVSSGFNFPLNKTTDGYDENNKFMINAGVYTITVPGDKSSVSVTPIPITVTLDPSSDFLNTLKCVPYGTVVTASSDLDAIVHNINPGEDRAVFMMTNNYYPGNSTVVTRDTVPGNTYTITCPGYNRVQASPYIGWIEPSAGDTYYYRPLHYLEQFKTSQSHQYNIVCDTLIGVWAADKILWAKSKFNDNPDRKDNDLNVSDYGIDIAHMQDAERGWDQSSWVMLDFTDYFDQHGISGNDEYLVVLNQFVNQQLKPLSVKGYYSEDNTYRIVVDDLPEIVADTIGFPGYMQDPLEKLAHPEDGSAPVAYYYNHYTPCNFMNENYMKPGEESGFYPPQDYDEFVAWVMSNELFASVWDYDWSDMDSWTDEQYDEFDRLYAEFVNTIPPLYFVRAKASEVAHVWGVWRGDDVFDVYERTVDVENGVIHNNYDLVGAFLVDGWQYNRLKPSPAIYGEPEGENALHENEAYEFHIAIMVPEGGWVDKKLKALPNAKGSPYSDNYLIYPLDLISHDTNVTSIPEITEGRMTDNKTVESVHYYNLMGVESAEPFQGINIVVTRYSDGSSTAVKVLR